MQRRKRVPLRVSLSGHRGAEAQARVQRIVAAASKLFITRGYHRTSLEAILKRSGGSKATLRKYFGNKAGLLGVVLTGEAARCVVRADRAAEHRSVVGALRAFARVVLEFYCRRDSLLVYRAVIAETAAQPEVGRRFHNGGHMTFVAALAKHLTHWQARGALVLIDATGDADRFLHLLRAGPHDQALLGVVERVSRAAIRAHVDACVRIFLDGLKL
jgi:AcrR family transcriptional regulator